MPTDRPQIPTLARTPENRARIPRQGRPNSANWAVVSGRIPPNPSKSDQIRPAGPSDPASAQTLRRRRCLEKSRVSADNRREPARIGEIRRFRRGRSRGKSNQIQVNPTKSRRCLSLAFLRAPPAEAPGKHPNRSLPSTAGTLTTLSGRIQTYARPSEPMLK